jgi:hypothetical protein
MFYENVDLTRIYNNPDFPLGAIHEEGGDAFEFVKYHSGDDPVNATPGYLAYYCEASGTEQPPLYTVTGDYNATTKVDTTYLLAAGMFMSILTNGKYGWIQKRGFNRIAMLSDASIQPGIPVRPFDGLGSIAIMVNTELMPIGRAFKVNTDTVCAIGTIKLEIF